MSNYRAGIPPALEHAVQHALAKDPRRRPPSARAMIDELKWAIGEDGFDPDATRLFREGSLRRRYEDVQVPQTARPDETTAERRQRAQDHAIEVEFWRSIKDSGDPEELRLYLARYPGGHYADLARRKIDRLAKAAVHPATNAGEPSDTLDPESPGLAAQPLLPENGPALAPEAPEPPSAAADETLVVQFRAKLAAPAEPAAQSPARWTVPRIAFSEHWGLPAIGVAGGVLVSAAILLAVSSLFEGSKPRKARGVSASNPVVSDAASLPVAPAILLPEGGREMGAKANEHGARRTQAGMAGPVVDARTH